MRRISIGLTALVLLGGLVVAMARAQEGSGSRGLASRLQSLRQPNAPQETGQKSSGTAASEEPRMLRSVLKRKPARIAQTPAVIQTPATPIIPNDGTGATSRSLNDAQSSRRSARRQSAPRYFRPRTPAAPNAPKTDAVKPQEQAPQEISRGPARPIGGNPPAAASPGSSSTEQLTEVIDSPQLSLQYRGPKEIRLGQPAEYQVVLTNAGQSAAGQVFVRVAIPKSVQIVNHQALQGSGQKQDSGTGPMHLIWEVPAVAARSNVVLSVQLLPKEDRVFNLQLDWSIRPPATTAQIRVLKPQLKLAISGPQELVFGETAVYTVTLSNPGTGDAENVMLNLNQAGAEAKQFAKLAAGQQVQIDLQLTASQAGVMQIGAMATADGGLNANATEQVLVRRAAFQLNVAAPRLVFAGALAKLQISVANTGNAAAKNVTAAAVLPAGAKYVAGLGQVAAEGQRLSWNVGDLKPGENRAYELQCELTLPGINQVQVAVVDSNKLSAAKSIATHVEALADLKLTVNDPKGPRSVGEEVEYEIQIVNRGTKAAEQIKVVAHFSEGVGPIRVTGGTAELLAAEGQVLFQVIPRLEAGQKLTLKIMAAASKAGSHNIRAVLECADPETELVSQETTRFYGEASTATRTQTGGQPTPAVR